MKTGVVLMFGALAGAMLLASCGECACKGHSDYLRDVPVTRSQRFQ